MGRLADRWHQTRLILTLGTFLVRGSIFSMGQTARSAFDKRFKREAKFSNLDLMTSTYEIMRDRLGDSLKEIEQKNRVLEESRENLVGSRNFLQAIVDNLDVDLLVFDGDMRVVQTNEKLSSKYLGKAAAGRFCYEVSRGAQVPCSSPSCVCPLDEVKKTRKAVRLIQKYAAERTQEVKDRYLEISVSPLSSENGDIVQFVELVRDVTESRELETRILEANRHLLVLNTISSAASQSLSLNIILNSALDQLLELFKAETGGILLCDEKAGPPRYSVHRNLPDDSPVGLISLELAKEVIETGETAKNNASSLDLESPSNFITLVGAPLKTKDKVVGVITVVSQTNRDFSLQEVQLLTSIGQQLGIILENAQLYQEAHQRLKESQQQLIRAEKLTSLGQLAASIAHEVNNPLSGVLMYTQLLTKKLKGGGIDSETALDYLSKMESELVRSTKLIRNLLNFARQSTPKLQQVNLNTVVNRTIDLTAHSAEMQHVRIIKELGPSLPDLTADSDQLQQVFTNLILNAIQAMPRGGSLTLRTSINDDQARAEVEDTGCGISPENMGKLFTPFFTTKPEIKGVGLGLAVTYGIIQRHKGRIEVRSKVGEGTTFTVYLPLHLETEETW
jgi:signal transduction histidine kinase